MIRKEDFLSKIEFPLNDIPDNCRFPYLVLTNAVIDHQGPTSDSPPLTFILLPDAKGESIEGMYGLSYLHPTSKIKRITLGFNLFDNVDEEVIKNWINLLMEKGLVEYIKPEAQTPEAYLRSYSELNEKINRKRHTFLPFETPVIYKPLETLLSSITSNHIYLSDERFKEIGLSS